jgi:hypothetical protein
MIVVVMVVVVMAVVVGAVVAVVMVVIMVVAVMVVAVMVAVAIMVAVVVMAVVAVVVMAVVVMVVVMVVVIKAAPTAKSLVLTRPSEYPMRKIESPCLRSNKVTHDRQVWTKNRSLNGTVNSRHTSTGAEITLFSVNDQVFHVRRNPKPCLWAQ